MAGGCIVCAFFYDSTWLDDCLYYLSAIYFFKVIFITFPFAFWSFTFITLQYGPFEFYSQLHNSIDSNCGCVYKISKPLDKCIITILWIIASLFLTIMVLFSIVVNTMIFEICNLTFIVIAGFTLNLEIQNEYSTLAPIIKFCSQAYNKMDLNLRIYIVNYCVLRQMSVIGGNLELGVEANRVFVQTQKTLKQWMAINIDDFKSKNNININTNGGEDDDIKHELIENKFKEIEVDLQVSLRNNIKDTIVASDKENENNKVLFDVKDGLSLHHFRNQYEVTVLEKILSNIRHSTRTFYDEIFSGCSCFDIRDTKLSKVKVEEYHTVKGIDYAYQKCGTMFLFPLYALSSIYTLLYPILCFICFISLLSSYNNNCNIINNVSLFNKFQIGLSCVYIFGLILICLLLNKVYKFYCILWHLIYIKNYIVHDTRFKFTLVEYDDSQSKFVNTNEKYSGDAALMKHIQFVYYNMYTMQLTAHILKQFFGPLSNVIFEMIGLSNTENAWDLAVDDVFGRLVVSKHLFDRVNVKLISGQNVGVGIETVKNVQELQKYRSQYDVLSSTTNGKFQNSRQRSAVKDLLGFDKCIFDIV